MVSFLKIKKKKKAEKHMPTSLLSDTNVQATELLPKE